MSAVAGYASKKEEEVEKVSDVEEDVCDSLIWNPNVRIPLSKKVIKADLSNPTTPSVELRRRQCIDKLKQYMKGLVETMGINELPNSAFESWLWHFHLHKTSRTAVHFCDPLLPTGEEDVSELWMAFREAGASERTSRKASMKLLTLSNRLTRSFQRESSGPGKKNVQATLKGDQYELWYKNTSISINSTHYDKLQILFQRSCRRHLQLKSTEFHRFLFCLLIRYDALEGGGYQAAINEEVFDVLLRDMKCQMECFASPFNCRYGAYCSAFGDIDGAFGSIGSFFDFQPKKGCFEANPPFLPQLILKMAQHMNGLLENTTEELCFVIIIPAWVETESWKMLRRSKWNREYIQISQESHGYLEGKQQMRPTRWRIASFDTSIFFWQNEHATTAFPITSALKENIKQAFRSKQATERCEKGLQQRGRRVKRIKS